MKIQSFDPDSPLLADFIQFSKSIYRGDPYYTGSDLIPDVYQIKLYIAYNGIKIVGRVAAIINNEIRYNGFKTGVLGWYECIDDDKVSESLISAAITYLYINGCVMVVGPVNGNTWNSYRLTEPSKSRPFFLENYHKPWYLRQFIHSKFSQITSYYSTNLHLHTSDDKRIGRFEKTVQERGIKVRNLRIDKYDEEIHTIYQICIRAFRNNFLYSPIDFDVFKKLYTRVQPFIDSSLVLIVEDSDGGPAAFIFTVPDLFDPEHRSAIIKTVAVIPGRKFQGLGTYLGNLVHKTLLHKGYVSVIHALIHESNISGNILSKESSIYRRYSLQGKKLV